MNFDYCGDIIIITIILFLHYPHSKTVDETIKYSPAC
jgi:hypothetical protein